MGEIADAFGTAFRDHNTPNVPSSGAYRPSKAPIRSIGTLIEAQLEGAAEGLVQTATWSALDALNGTRQGQPGRVTGTDAGTHTDPVVGGVVANEGEYAWSTSPAGWERVGNLVDADALQAASTAGINLSSIGIASGTASLASTTWTVSWAGCRASWSGVTVTIDDLPSTAVASAETIYIDLVGDSSPYQLAKATSTLSLRNDFAAGRKIQLLYNVSGALIGPLASALVGFALSATSTDGIAQSKQMAQAVTMAGPLDAYAARATEGASTWSVSWQAARLQIGTSVVTVDDLPVTTVAASSALYIDLVGDSSPYQVGSSAMASIASDVAAGRKIVLFYNHSGIPMGVMAPAIMTAALKVLHADKIIVEVAPDNIFYVYQKANAIEWASDTGATATACTYIRWTMQYMASEVTSVAGWQIQRVHEVIRKGFTSFDVVRELCDDGNFEMAFNEDGLGSSGGMAHGNEIAGDAVLMADGRIIALDTETTYFAHCRRVSFVQPSTLYKRGTEPPATVVNALCDRRYEWERGTLTVEQYVTVKRSFTVTYLMLGMFPVDRFDPDNGSFALTANAVRYAPLLQEDIDNDAFASVESKAWCVKLEGPNNHTFEMEAILGWDKPLRRSWIQSDANRNKCYLDFLGNGYVTTVDEVVHAKVQYRIQKRLARGTFG